MYKLLIVDDDVEMLQGLKNIINWEEYGLTISGAAKNGFEALNILSECIPDIVITDITMPVLNGLEFIREAKKFNENIKTIILTCHEDFNFARKAISLEADEYILKHTLTENNLIETVIKIKDKLNKELSQKEELKKTVNDLNSNKNVIIEKLFNDILENESLTIEDIGIRAGVVSPDFFRSGFRLVSLYAGNLEEVLKNCPIDEYSLFKFSILNIMEETLQKLGNAYYFCHRKDAFGIILWDEDNESPIKQKTLNLIKELQSNINLCVKVKLSVCFSSIYTSIMRLKEAVDENEKLRDSYFYLNPGQIVIEKLQYSIRDVNELYREFGEEFRNILSLRNKTRISEWVNLLFDKLAAMQLEPGIVKVLIRRLIIDMEVSMGKNEIGLDRFHIKGDTLADYRQIFEEILKYLLKNTGQTLNIPSRNDIRRVLEYIENHIGEDISCEGMANMVSMNSNYFSRLFKSEVGESFSDYVLNKRMVVATELLSNSSLSIEDIVKSIGIESISYFYRAYKKNTGNTPGDVRYRLK